MKILGLMSGTSADGLDIALCDISGQPPHLHASILYGTTQPYPPDLREQILCACNAQCSQTSLVSELNMRLGRFMAGQSKAALAGWQTDADLIASHGQTIWHNVTEDGTVSSTLQIGSAAALVEATGITTIHDFRSRDVAAGGQGAPLTAYVDWLLLRHPTKTRAIQNIGGIGNVSVLPPLSAEDTTLFAFDTGPGNVLIDHAVAYLTDNRQTYDKDGLLASQGQINADWLHRLLQHPYYAQQPPKTTGRELFTHELAMAYVREGQTMGLSAMDIIATLTALTSRTIAKAYADHIDPYIDEVIIGGGGSRNLLLMRHLVDDLAPAQVRTHDDIGIDSNYKEALAFAVLAYESWHLRPGTLPAQTGAAHASILGSITPGNNYRDLLRRTWINRPLIG